MWVLCRVRAAKLKLGSEVECCGRIWAWARISETSSFSPPTTLSLFPIPRATRLFCDVYNPQSKTYCKRLQVLCPEHSRDPKVRFSLNSPHSDPPTFLTAPPPFLFPPDHFHNSHFPCLITLHSSSFVLSHHLLFLPFSLPLHPLFLSFSILHSPLNSPFLPSLTTPHSYFPS